MSVIFGAGSGKFESEGDEPTLIAYSHNPSWRKYGLTDEAFGGMYARQGGRCAICHEERRLEVDHDHASGKVRALLCHRCNWVLGVLRDEPELAELIVRYLESHA